MIIYTYTAGTSIFLFVKEKTKNALITKASFTETDKIQKIISTTCAIMGDVHRLEYYISSESDVFTSQWKFENRGLPFDWNQLQ